MDFMQAYRTIVKRSPERNTKEIPTILSCLDFECLDCLEIGPGPDARLAIKLSGFAKHITTLVKDRSDISSINRIIKEQGLRSKISCQAYSQPGKLPFKTNSFDVVYGAWLPHKLVTDPAYLDEVVRVAKKHILFIMPGIKGDEPKLVSIVKPGEKQRRQTYKSQISRYLRSKAWKVNFTDNILRMDFASKQEIRQTYYALAFRNDLTPIQKTKINAFLDKRIHNYRNGFYCIHAQK